MSGVTGQTPVTLISRARMSSSKAYNRIVELARLEGAEFVLLFDQDSMPSEGMVGGLDDLADELVRQGEKPAVIGPRPVKANGEPFEIPRRRSGRLGAPGLAVDFAISSGSLIASRLPKPSDRLKRTSSSTRSTSTGVQGPGRPVGNARHRPRIAFSTGIKLKASSHVTAHLLFQLVRNLSPTSSRGPSGRAAREPGDRKLLRLRGSPRKKAQTRA